MWIDKVKTTTNKPLNQIEGQGTTKKHLVFNPFKISNLIIEPNNFFSCFIINLIAFKISSESKHIYKHKN